MSEWNTKENILFILVCECDSIYYVNLNILSDDSDVVGDVRQQKEINTKDLLQ